ncbi:antibiotic biosynthesis monooxygenase [Kordiimonas sp.]|uniref:antibiotic biosynthesis monooxygenase n=1 Tax=Kordiimonas sp. TaxID=1970157 RepID=UPI003A9562C8
MIARLWTGYVPNEKADEYLGLMKEVAIPDYKSISANLGALCLHRQLGPATMVTMLTFWPDIDAIKQFAGEAYDTAKYYDFDPDFLLKMPDKAEHFEVIGDLGLGNSIT